MKKITKTQKLQNKRKYNQIRKVWEKTNKAEDYKYFKRLTLAEAEANNLSIKQAAKKAANTEDFVSAAERSRTNLLKGIKEQFRDTYDKIRNLSRSSKGQFKNISENLTWDKDRAGYIFTGINDVRYFIDVTDSPKEVRVYAI